MQRTNGSIIRMKHVGLHRRELPDLRGKLRRKGDVQMRREEGKKNRGSARMRREGGKTMKGNARMRRGNGPIRRRWSWHTGLYSGAVGSNDESKRNYTCEYCVGMKSHSDTNTYPSPILTVLLFAVQVSGD